MLHQRHFSRDNNSSSEERLTAFGVIFGQAVVQWNGRGRPCSAAPETFKCSRPPASASIGITDIRRRIAKVLNDYGPQGPGSIGIRIRRSHRVVFEALKSLTELGVVMANGSTRGRRFTLVENWEAALARAINEGSRAIETTQKQRE
jgi:hypothetical protein